MGRAPCCDKANVKKGPWSPEEDAKLKEYIDEFGTGGNWIALPQKAGLRRCGKSCRLRWLNYLRPNLKHGEFSDDEERIICTLFANIGSRWSIIAAQLPGRTDNDIKNYWNTKLKKKFMGIVPQSHQTNPDQANLSSSSIKGSNNNNTYYSSVRSFTGLEPILMAPNYFSQPQESFMMSPIQNNLIMFGGEASCSSSDGSHGRDIEYEYGGGSNGEELGLQSYSTNGVQENQKFMISNGNNGVSEMWRETSLNFCLEEIKQLISTNGINNNILFDENKTEERVMYY